VTEYWPFIHHVRAGYFDSWLRAPWPMQPNVFSCGKVAPEFRPAIGAAHGAEPPALNGGCVCSSPKKACRRNLRGKLPPSRWLRHRRRAHRSVFPACAGTAPRRICRRLEGCNYRINPRLRSGTAARTTTYTDQRKSLTLPKAAGGPSATNWKAYQRSPSCSVTAFAMNPTPVLS
jgi:hypothetical protein